jgi:hypothetical protein
MGWGRMGGKTVSAEILTVLHDGSGTANERGQHTHPLHLRPYRSLLVYEVYDTHIASNLENDCTIRD